jgi:hypothetical protein
LKQSRRWLLVLLLIVSMSATMRNITQHNIQLLVGQQTATDIQSVAVFCWQKVGKRAVGKLKIS